MVPLTGGQWADVRTLASGHIPADSVDAEKIHVRHLSSFSRVSDAARFLNLAEVETRRRKLVQAKEVGAVMDGADWLHTCVEIHRADAGRILDCPHAAEHVNKRVEALSAGGRTFPAGMLERCFHLLTPRGPALLTRMAERLAEQETSQPDLREHLGSVRKRLPLMQSPTFRRAGWPIGSGMVESANTLVGEARLKGTGMRWERTNVKPMLALRNGVCHERWQETWQAARNQRRDLLTQRRHPRSAPRQEAEAEALTHVPVEPPLPMSPPAPLLPPDPPPMLPGTSRPSAHHPWKRGPSCAPSQCAQR